MSQTDDDMITDRVVSAAKRMDEMDDPEEFDALEIQVLADIDGTAREVIAVTGVGGPRIEVNLTRGVVDGWWGLGNHHKAEFRNEDLTQQLEDRFLTSWVAAETQR